MFLCNSQCVPFLADLQSCRQSVVLACLHAPPSSQAVLSAHGRVGASAAADTRRAADEVDAIAPKRDSVAREMERRIVAQLLTCLDDLGGPLPGAPAQAHPEDLPRDGGSDPDEPAAAAPHKHVIVIGAAPPLHGWLLGLCGWGVPKVRWQGQYVLSGVELPGRV